MAGLTSADVRVHNLGLILGQLDRGAASRSELAAATGLARGALTSMAAELIDAGLVRAAEPGGRPARGRPQEKLELDGARVAVVAVQFALDALAVRAVDLAGRVILACEDESPLRGSPEAVAARIAAALRSARADIETRGMRIARFVVVAAAPIAAGTQRVAGSVDFGWGDVDLRSLVAAEIGEADLRMVGDAKVAAYAEYAALAAEDPSITDIVYLKSDTGIGGGVVVGGQVLEGASGFAYEPGHVPMVPGGEPCRCGQRGCLVTVAGPDIVLRRAGIRGAVPAGQRELRARYERGERAAREAFDGVATWLRLAIAQSIVLFQPHRVVLGGYLAAFADELREGLELRDGVEPHLRDAVVPARLGPWAGLEGALLRVRRELLADPSGMRGAAT